MKKSPVLKWLSVAGILVSLFVVINHPDTKAGLVYLAIAVTSLFLQLNFKQIVKEVRSGGR